MKNRIILFLLIASLVVSGCGSANLPKSASSAKDANISMDSCADDSDCACGGVDRNTGRCFLGNIEYQKRYVDMSRQCPDFCSGIAGNLVTRCVDSKCMQMYECIAPSDCKDGYDCIRNRCVSGKSSSPQSSGSGSNPECRSDSDCKAGGCSGQLCLSASKSGSTYTTCEYREEFGCLKYASCGCVGGKCAWDKGAEYSSCMAGLTAQ